MAKAHRTEMRSSKGKKLYAVRDKEGKFEDIQTYERAHRADMAHKSKAEMMTAAKTTAKKKTAKKKAAPKKKMAKKKAGKK
jgi:hypothetical protein